MSNMNDNGPCTKAVLESPTLRASAGVGSCGDEMSAARGKDVVNLRKRKVAHIVDAIPRVRMFWKQ